LPECITADPDQSRIPFEGDGAERGTIAERPGLEMEKTPRKVDEDIEVPEKAQRPMMERDEGRSNATERREEHFSKQKSSRTETDRGMTREVTGWADRDNGRTNLTVGEAGIRSLPERSEETGGSFGGSEGFEADIRETADDRKGLNRRSKVEKFCDFPPPIDRSKSSLQILWLILENPHPETKRSNEGKPEWKRANTRPFPSTERVEKGNAGKPRH
jgi:hypothetical protein